jgi:hypothetical protein
MFVKIAYFRRMRVYHLFLRCPIARNCRSSIGVIPPGINCPQRATNRLIREGAMEIIILMTWSIWKFRNG